MLLLAAVAVIAVLGDAATSSAQASTPSEYQVKAAYLYNFGRFVTWPAIPAAQDGSFTICVLGRDPFGATLDAAVAGHPLGGKPVAVKRIAHPEEASGCRILFIDSEKAGSLKEILPALSHLPVLTVSDMPDFSQRGGMIQFVLEDSRVRFEVNLTNAESAGLTMSSELLKVASGVKGRPRTGPGN